MHAGNQITKILTNLEDNNDTFPEIRKVKDRNESAETSSHLW